MILIKNIIFKITRISKRTGNLIILNDKITKYFRLDRLNTNEKSHVWVNKVNKYDIINLKFHDYHSLRPYKKYKKWNDIILNTLLQSKSL